MQAPSGIQGLLEWEFQLTAFTPIFFISYHALWHCNNDNGHNDDNDDVAPSNLALDILKDELNPNETSMRKSWN